MGTAMRVMSGEADEILSERILMVDSLYTKSLQCAGTRLVYRVSQETRITDQDRQRLEYLQPIFSFFASTTISASWGRTHVPILESLSYPDDSLIFTFSAIPRKTIEPRCEVSKAIPDLDAFQLEWLSKVFKPREHEAKARDQLGNIHLQPDEYGLDLMFTVFPSHSDQPGSDIELDFLDRDLQDDQQSAGSERDEEDRDALALAIEQALDEC